MDINKNQQVNTFLKGMNTDISDSLIDTSQYRYAENLLLTTNTEHNTGELRLVEGNVEIKKFTGLRIIYINSIRDYVVVITATTTSWSIYVNDNKGVGDWTLLFGPCTDLLWDSLDTVAISGVMRYESDNNIKLYIADNTERHVIIPINIDESHRTENPPSTDINYLIGYQNIFLNSPIAEVSTDVGHLKPAKVLYIYRLYKTGGAATTLSPVGNVVSLYKSNTEGYSNKELTSKAIKITINLDNIYNLDRIQLFRITYEYNGLLPTIHKIKDSKIKSSILMLFTDYGDNIEQLGIDELLSFNQMQIKPKIIESKGDTLFAVNVKYVQDDTDSKFSSYDTRSFSSGNYWKKPGDNVKYPILFQDGVLIEPEEIHELCHKQFNDTGTYSYNESYWKTFDSLSDSYNNTIGGKGTNIDWELILSDVSVNRYGTSGNEHKNYYRSGETYRFGAILYDNKGQASSVKWIADIRIPFRKNTDYRFAEGEGNALIIMYNIKFIIKHFPNDCKAIQIVQCPRTINDRYVITLGIVGFPMRTYKYNDSTTTATNYICPSGLMTLLKIEADGSDANSDNNAYARYATTESKILQFASPEYAYLSDDIKNILDQYKNSISIKHVAAFNIYSEEDTTKLTNGSIVYPKTLVGSNYTEYGSGFAYKKKYNSQNKYSLLVDKVITGYDVDQMNSNYPEFLLIDNDYLGSINRNFVGRRLIQKKFAQSDLNNGFKYGYLAFNHILPLNVVQDATPTYYNINSFSYPTVPSWDKFADKETIRFNEDVTPIGTFSYINWTYPLCLDLPTGSDSYMAKCLKRYDNIAQDQGRSEILYPIGTGGKCILIDLEYGVKFNGLSDYYFSDGESGKMAPIHVANLVKECTPYGGYNLNAINNSIYHSFGDIVTKQQFDEANTNAYDLPLTGGDAYIGFFRYNAAHLWYDPIYIAATKQATVYEVPIESDIDLNAECGAKFMPGLSESYYIQDEAVSLPGNSGGYSQDKPTYQYNTAYNQTPNVITHSSIEYNEISNYNWDVRVHNSDLKTNGELIDNWLVFKALNYLDVDSRHGEITDLKLFKDRLIFWQDDAVGILSSNERTMLNDSDGNQIILGNGGILLRSDYISTTYGMKKDQFVSTQSNTTLYWWDGNNKEILAYTENGLLPLGSLKAVRNYLNQYNENVHPYMFYDIKNKEVVSSVVNNESLVYSEQIEAFSSVYKFMPLYGTELADQVLTANDTAIYKLNVTGNGVSELFGQRMLPKLQYVVNSLNMFPKVFDIQTFGGRFYGGDNITNLQFNYKTPLKQQSNCTGSSVTNREYDFRLDIPRNNNDPYGGRMRGKTMKCEFSSTSNSTDFSLQYIVTKYRMSWS